MRRPHNPTPIVDPPSTTTVCPVMKVAMESEAKAAGKVTHEGVTYFVCCEPCVKKFKDSPAQYAAAK